MKAKTLKLLLPVIVLLIIAISTVVLAGSLNPSASPAATIYTIEDVYQRLVAGTTATEANHSLSPSASANPTMHTLKQLYQAIPNQGSNVAGTDGQLSFTIPSGIYHGTELCTASDTNLTQANVKAGTTIFGVTGDYYVGFPSNCTTPRFTDNGNGTVTDNCTSLVWTKCWLNASGGITDKTGCTDAHGTFDWSTAVADCGALTLSGISDWRLPSILELGTIIDYGLSSTAIDTSIFLNAQYDSYWSANEDTNNTGFAFLKDVGTGRTNSVPEFIAVGGARCVRP